MMQETKRILIVENDIDTLTTIYTTLLPLNYEVEAAIESSELRPRIERFQPDLLMLGQKLNDADALELCAWIKKNYTARVILIGQSKQLSRAWSGGLCFDDELPKPVNPSELLSKLNSHLTV